MTDQELAATSVLALPIDEASAKVRTGTPKDDAEDLAWPVWAGVVPLALVPGEPQADEHVPAGLTAPGPERLQRRRESAVRVIGAVVGGGAGLVVDHHCWRSHKQEGVRP